MSAPAIAGPAAAEAAPPRCTLTVSVVVYRPHLPELRDTFASLRVALDVARQAGVLDRVTIELIDNGTDVPDALDRLVRESLGPADWLAFVVRRGHGNVGYGRGHNLAISASGAAYHLVLNPDLVLDPGALRAAFEFMRDQPEVGLVSPHVVGADGTWQSLARRAPTLLALGLRGFAPARVRALFATYLARYELRDRVHPGAGVVFDVPCATGCFMFARGDVIRRVGGFHDGYFLYFEDYDLSLAMGRVARNAYVPRVRVRHLGGGAARKGFRHVRLFTRSAATFFNRHGWRVV